MTVPPAPGSDADPLLAVWTLDALTDVALLADEDAAVTVTDVYGATRTVDVVGGEATTFRATGAPQFLAAPSSTRLRVAALDGGSNLLAGGTVTASSTSDGDAATLVTAEGALATPWRAGGSTAEGPDVSPWVRVELAEPATLDRVVIGSAGIRCCTTGVKDAVVEVESDGAWTEVGRVEGAFLERTSTVRFDPVEATAVRVTVPTTEQRDVTIPSANYSGQSGGLLPAWEPVQAEPTWPVSLVGLAAYGPGRAP
nr:discoidin domain-containing protein [Cellulomonas hominis]